jgi:hypothetical protein
MVHRLLMPLELALLAVSGSIFNEFQFNSTVMTEPWSVLRRSHKLGTGQIQIAFTRAFLR